MKDVRNTQAMAVKQITSNILRDVCELPDRDSPEDNPDLLLVTYQELALIVSREITDHLSAANLEIHLLKG